MIRLATAALVAGAVLTTSVSTAAAQDVATGGGAVKLMGAEATNRMKRGKLQACELSYRIAFEDHIYRQGGVTLLRGALSLIGAIDQPDKAPGILFKVTAFDLHGQSFKLSPLEYAYLSTGGQSYAGKEFVKFPAEDGGLIIGYEMLNHPDLAMALNGPINLNITRKGGGTDVAVPINLQRDKPEVGGQQSKCVVQLMDALLAKIGAQ